ncbi:VOC family protein [Mycolicibacterium sp. Dal123E01]|uniref:VOC family protein n=1 Tax=Mycolicibacterium sp. Dal123E01 TaxID=3457578 RepID=UPI00403EF676
MLGHLGINVTDLPTARTYYDALMPLVGFERFLDDSDQFAYRPAEGKRGTYLFFYPALEPTPYACERAGLQHLAFMVRTRSAVKRIHRFVQDHGGEVVHEPQAFPQYPPPYFATFWRDPFGMMLEAVCHHDRD